MRDIREVRIPRAMRDLFILTGVAPDQRLLLVLRIRRSNVLRRLLVREAQRWPVRLGRQRALRRKIRHGVLWRWPESELRGAVGREGVVTLAFEVLRMNRLLVGLRRA